MNVLNAQGPVVYFLIFDYIVVLVALLANCFVAIAVTRTSSFGKQSFYRAFLLSLIASDIYVSAVNILSLCYQLINEFHGSPVPSVTSSDYWIIRCGANFLRTLRLTAFVANLLSLCGMSLSHFIGVVFPAKYRYLSGRKTSAFSVIGVWLFCCLLGLLDIPITIFSSNEVIYSTINPSFKSNWTNTESYTDMSSFENQWEENEQFNFGSASALPQDPAIVNDTVKGGKSKSETVKIIANMFTHLQNEEMKNKIANFSPCNNHSMSKMWLEITVIILALCSAVLLTIAYCCIIRKIKMGNQENLGFTYRKEKSVSTTIVLIAAFIFCWVPFALFELVMLLIFTVTKPQISESLKTAAHGESFIKISFIVQYIFNSILMMYPLVDAVIYSIRIPVVKQTILEKIPFSKFCIRMRAMATESSQNNENGQANNTPLVTMNGQESHTLTSNVQHTVFCDDGTIVKSERRKIPIGWDSESSL